MHRPKQEKENSPNILSDKYWVVLFSFTNLKFILKRDFSNKNGLVFDFSFFI